jgi:hypothetical protein
MDDRAEFNRYLTIFALAAPTAAAIYFVFRSISTNLGAAETATGYVDSMTQMGIYLGYAVMVGGTLVFGVLALWAAVRLVGVLAARRRGR